ncbi:hypothetical protein Tco_0950177 [Tanacetum coccineum]
MDHDGVPLCMRRRLHAMRIVFLHGIGVVTGTFHDPNTPHEFQWINPTTKVAEDGTETTTAGHIEAYHNVSKEIRDQLDAKAEIVQIILTRIDNDIYSTVDACPNACEMWKAIERLKQGESINVQDLETNLYWEFGKFTSRDGESLKSYYLRIAKNEVYDIRVERQAHTTNPLALVAQQQPVYHSQNHPTNYTKISSTRSHQATTRNRGKAIINSPKPTYNQEPAMVTDNDEMSKEKEIAKLMALIFLSFKKIYKPTNNNFRTSSNIKVTPNAAEISGPIFDAEPLQNVQHDDDNYNVFANEREHHEQPESVNDIHMDKHNIIIDSLDMCHDRE